MINPILKINNLTARYDNIKAIRNINFEVFNGEIITLIGSNGAGKSTTLKSISGLIQTKSGEITFYNETIDKESAHKITQKGLVLCPEGRQIFSDLTVIENLKIGAYLRNDNSQIEKDLNFVMELFPILSERKDQSAQTLSGGEQQMLAIARSYMSKPKLLMLDEPSLGVAPIIVSKIFDAIKQINSQGVSIVLVEQNAILALEVSNRAYVMTNGEITLQGDSRDLLSRPEIKKAYLGN